MTRFGDIGTPATAPFTTDEEASGVIPVDFLGLGKLLIVTQAHYPNGASLVEGGQLMLVDTNPVPEASTVIPTALLGLAGVASYARGRFSRKAVK